MVEFIIEKKTQSVLRRRCQLRNWLRKHDREVGRVANEYLRKGYTVLADLADWEQPDTVKGVRPDLSVKKKGHETLIEVETPESEESKRDEKQKKILKQWSEKSQQKHFRRIITEE